MTSITPTAPAPDAPTATVSAVAAPEYDGLSIGLTADVPAPPDLKTRADRVGLPGVRPGLAAACRKLPAVERWQGLRLQIADAEKKVAAAAEAVRRSVAAKVLLERDLAPDLAEKLRAVEAEAGAAVAARDAALRDLDVVRHLIPKHFVPAANAIGSQSLTTVTPLLSRLTDREREARAALDAGCARVAEVLAKALTDHVAGPAAELLTVRRAVRLGWADNGALERGLRDELLGPIPAGVRQQARGIFEVIPPAPPPSEEVPTAAPARGNPYVEVHGNDPLTPAERARLRHENGFAG